MEEFIAIGKQRNLPTMNDCAADVPPIENMFEAHSTRVRHDRGVGRQGDSRTAIRRHSGRARGPDPRRSQEHIARTPTPSGARAR